MRRRDGAMDNRLSARECHEYFEHRPWENVLKFYSLVASGEASLNDLIINRDLQCSSSSSSISCTKIYNVGASELVVAAKGKGARWDRRTFKITLSYNGSAFAGWQKQPGFVTVQSVLEKELGKFVDGKRARNLEEKGQKREALVAVAGRTDKGVHACGQVCSFYTWMKDVKAEDVENAINSYMPRVLRAICAEEVDRDFHPIFSAKWRRYVYLFPLKEYEEFEVNQVSKLLQSLEGLSLSYAVFARDTKISRSSGPATFCTVYHARAIIGELPTTTQDEDEGVKVKCKAMVVEIVADRFLRKMVRVLVSTAVREAICGDEEEEEEDALLVVGRERLRTASAPPAPAFGLCLAQVGYHDDHFDSLITS